MRKALLFAVVVLHFFQSNAQEGFIDPSFGNNGYVTFPFNFGSPSLLFRLTPTAFQPDGKLVGAQRLPSGDVAIHRYNTDGTPDNSFGSGGVAISNLDAAHIVSMTVQSDGKILIYSAKVSPIVDPVPFDAVIARYHSNGTPDASFGMNGRVIISGTPWGNIALQADGKILISVLNIGTTQVIRLQPNGTQDMLNISLFNPFPSGAGADDPILAAQADGKIVLVRSTLFGFMFNRVIELYRFNNNGTPDASFGTNGVVRTPFANPSEFNDIIDLVLQTDGKIIIGTTDSRILRFTANGILDPTFGNGGVVTHIIEFTQLLLQNDGKIVAGGYFDATGANGHFLLARYNPNGTFDPSFGYGGMMVTPFTPPGTVRKVIQNMTIANNRLYVYGNGTDNISILAAYQVPSQVLLPSAPAIVKKEIPEKLKEQKFYVLASPNPATSYFVLRLQGSGHGPVQIRVLDASGRIVEQRRNTATNTTLRIGDGYRPGLYYAEVIQGGEKQTVPLIKR